ncbi:hypothetical protein QYE76_019334 [Lolium multiflorum]|uniref:Uncharacterized protein n=1 Tax=Lolium multiflorum TaxID=4521 RepID=A0AAD8VN15_LOLMU|nr:hypothetical protein QYE76_019334 [Lolium multiflorum]
MTFGSFRFLIGKEESHRLSAPIFSGPFAAKSDLSESSATSVESGDEEASQPRCIKPTHGVALEDLFGGMTFGSFTETGLSQDSDSESFTSFDSAYNNNSFDNKVFTDLSDGVTCPEFEGSTTHQICVITGEGREADEESESFDDLGNPYIDPADFTRGTGRKYIGTEPREKVRLPQEAWDRATKAMDGTEPMTTQVSPAALQAVAKYDEEISQKALEDDVDAIDEARDVVLSRVSAYQQSLKNYHSRRLQPRSFEVGDLVLRLKQDSHEKLESPWVGPYIVTEKDSIHDLAKINSRVAYLNPDKCKFGSSDHLFSYQTPDNFRTLENVQ